MPEHRLARTRRAYQPDARTEVRTMNDNVSVERILQIQLAEYPETASLYFCPHCPFQYPPNTVGASHCPDCGHRLLILSRRQALAVQADPSRF